ncbi:SF3a splicing factor complex subunit [Coemansia erecta]|nr:SF3a splicing factor complex subunit [Coemansia erecta]
METIATSPQTKNGQQQTSKKAMIYPPQDIKTIVDKTAEHVAKSGTAFEQLIREKYQDNAKFSFIYQNDPYFAYYEHMVDRFRTSDGNSEDQEKNSGTEPKGEEAMDAKDSADGEQEMPEKPPMMQFISGMPAVSALDLDVIRTTAQFVARNGRQFMAQLAQREQGNYQFDFLQPTHSLFGYFRKLVDQYSLVYFPPPDLTTRVETDVLDRYGVLDRVERRMRWTVFEEEEKKKREEEREREKEAALAIDWHDFVVVGTVEFVEEDEAAQLPVPMRLQDLKTLSLEAKHSIAKESGTASTSSVPVAPGNAPRDAVDDDGDDVEMEVEAEDEEDVDEYLQADGRPAAPSTLPAVAGPMKIRHDYVPNLRRGPPAPQTLLHCELCGSSVPASDFDEHIRVELIDPKWKEQKLAFERKIRDSNLVQEGMDIARYLRQLAVHRVEGPDNQAESHEQQVVPWDGFSSTAGRAARRARENLTAEEQSIADMCRKGLVDPRDPSLAIGPQMPAGRPPAKRARNKQPRK